MPPRPGFLVIGAAKSGTTSLCELLRQHPEVFLSRRKELHFFSFDALFARGTAWYEAFFAGAGGARAIGEGSTTYTVRKVFPRAAERIAAFAPDIKLVYLVREPFARMESVWLQLRRFGAASPFRDLGIDDVPAAMRVDLAFDRAVFAQADVIVESTNYLRELEVYRQHFADDQILVLFAEDLQREPRAVARRLFAFLGVDPDIELPNYDLRRNSMEEYRLPRAGLWRLLASPRRRRVYAAIAGMLPQSLRSWVGLRLLRQRVTARPQWSHEAREFARSRLGADLQVFVDRYHGPHAAWSVGLTRS